MCSTAMHGGSVTGILIGFLLRGSFGAVFAVYGVNLIG
jgi:hypothetical protein